MENSIVTNIEKNNNENKKYNLDDKKKENKFLIILFIIFTILGIFSFLLYFLFSPPVAAAKPIIYIYPEQKLELNVNLAYPEKVSCSYPNYNATTGWNVIAYPDGTLTEINTNKKLYSLYWEGKNYNQTVQNEGFIVKGEDSIEFLEEKLALLGLNYREAEEFIIYWLPKLQENKYNYIRFATMEEINEYMPLEFSTQPDSLIRVFMEFKGLNHFIDISEQKLETPKREGFVIVEWGGSEIK